MELAAFVSRLGNIPQLYPYLYHKYKLFLRISKIMRSHAKPLGFRAGPALGPNQGTVREQEAMLGRVLSLSFPEVWKFDRWIPSRMVTCDGFNQGLVGSDLGTQETSQGPGYHSHLFGRKSQGEMGQQISGHLYHPYMAQDTSISNIYTISVCLCVILTHWS